jgi:hypothetical protein
MKFIDTRGMFDISDSCTVEVTEIDKIGPIITIKNIYKYPSKIKTFLSSTPAPIWKCTETSKNFVEYFDCRHDIILGKEPLRELFSLVIPILEKEAGLHMNKYPHPAEIVTNIFQDICIPSNSVHAIPHTDPYHNMLVPFTTEEEGYSSTKFYKPKKGDMPLEDFIDHNDLEEIGELYYILDIDKYWDTIYEVPHVFNQAIIFGGDVYHGAHHTGFKKSPRINQLAFISAYKPMEEDASNT